MKGMRVARLSLISLIAALCVAAVALGLAVAFRGGGGPSAAAPTTPSCGTRLLHDWADGRIDRTYPVACYRAALGSMPTDLEVYSSAPDDIAQALSQRIVQSRTQKISGHQGAPSVRKPASAR